MGRARAGGIAVIYEEDAEEWALYLQEVFLRVLERESVRLCCLGPDLPHLPSVRCKLLILSDGLLQGLTPEKSHFLGGALAPPESVVTLLCGPSSSEPLYQALGVPRGRWELTTEQEPEDYVCAVERLLLRGCEDHLEVTDPTATPRGCSGDARESKGAEASAEARGGPQPAVLVLPRDVLCESPGEIFIVLRDEEIRDSLEVEFRSATACVRARPGPCSGSVWRTQALALPAGPVHVDVYCDGTLKASAEIESHTRSEAVAAGAGAGGGREELRELDQTLTALFQHEMQQYEFQAEQPAACAHGECAHAREVPTLLHCAAKFGLQSLALHLLGCPGAGWAATLRNEAGLDPAGLAGRCGHQELRRILQDFATHEISTNREQKDDRATVPAASPDTAPQEAQPQEQKSGVGKEASSTEPAAGTEPELWQPEEQPEDLYACIPGDSPDCPARGPPWSRPPLPPPRPATATVPLDTAPCRLQGKALESHAERSQPWRGPGSRPEAGGEPSQEEEREEEEEPYTFAEIDDSDYDMVLAHRSTRKKTANRSFIINRPPAPAPRPPTSPPKEETTPYIARVFQQKTAGRQSDGDKFHGAKKQDRAREGSHVHAVAKSFLDAGQEELILLQERVRNGELTVDKALERFRHWQLAKADREAQQQEKLRQLRDCIVGNRPDDEHNPDHLTIVHHPNGSESIYNENKLLNLSLGNKLPARGQVEKEFGFCCKKDH